MSVGQDTVILVVMLIFFAVVMILLIPFIVKEHRRAISREKWRKATNRPIFKEEETMHLPRLYPVNGRNISLDSKKY